MRVAFGLTAANAAIAVLFLAGCATRPPPQLRSAPTPSKAEILQLRALQSRTLAVPRDAIFPRILDVLIDNGYLIRSASPDGGLVSFYQQWSDASQGDANITQEGSVLFEPVDSTHTLVRVALTGGWQQLQVTGGGAKSTDMGMVASVSQTAPAEEYKKLLDVLESGLTDQGKP